VLVNYSEGVDNYLSRRSLCDGPITCPKDRFRVWCVWVWSRNRNDEGPRTTRAALP